MEIIQNCNAVLFDLDGTLHLNIAIYVQRFLDVCTGRGLQLPVLALKRVMRSEHAYGVDRPRVERDRVRFGKGAAFWEHFAAMQLRTLGLGAAVAVHAAAIAGGVANDGALSTAAVPVDVRPTLQALRQRGYTVALVSNRMEALDTVVAELEMQDLFDFTLAAGEVDCWKPEPGIMHAALRMARTAPHAAVYVGDNYYADVAGARIAGLTPVLIDRHEVFPVVNCLRIVELGELLAVLPGV